MISKGSLVRTPERLDGADGDVCVVISDPYPERPGGHETVDLYIARHKQVQQYYTHALTLLSQ